MFRKLSDWAVAKAPEKHRKTVRRALGVAIVAFVIFELTRFVAIVPYLAPALDEVARQGAVMASLSPLAAVTAFTVSVIAFLVPMTLFVWALRWTHRKLFHSGTAG